MRIEILEEAETDLLDGFDFYEWQGSGLGQYFLDSLFSDIDSLQLYAGIHEQVYGFHRLLSKRFPARSITKWTAPGSGFSRSWIVVSHRDGPANGWLAECHARWKGGGGAREEGKRAKDLGQRRKARLRGGAGGPSSFEGRW